MSFAFMPVYTGDYLRDTRHLTPLKHGIFYLLLMHCWDQKGPLPLDEQECAGIANCRSADEIESLRYILARFFVRMEDGFYNHRMQKEIERANSISQARSEAGFKGYQARAKQLPNKSNARASTPTPTTTPTTTLTPSPTPTTTNRTKTKQASPTAPVNVDPQVWQDWLDHRKTKRAKVTQTVVDEITAQAAKAGITLEKALRMCCQRGWIGFEASWITKDKEGQAARVAKLLFGDKREVIDAK
jgi:uncharacterized protein YdaU (DUF1376 family)